MLVELVISCCKTSTVSWLVKNVYNAGDKIFMSVGSCSPVLLKKWCANGMSMSLLSMNKLHTVCGGSDDSQLST